MKNGDMTYNGYGMRTYIDNTYDAAGNKLRTTVGRQMTIGPIRPTSLGGGAEPQGGGLSGGLPGGLVNPVPSSNIITTDYCGNAIYRGDTLSMLLTEKGYVTFTNDTTPVYHYYLKDHLGSVRVVFDQDGAVEQRNDYYASGALMYTSTGGTVQPYKFGGKELERTAGLDEYDFGARWMDPVIGGRFTTMDPMCEKYYEVSPYVYCHGDPINWIDPSGTYEYPVGITSNQNYGVIAILPSNYKEDKSRALIYDYNASVKAKVPVVLVDDMDDLAKAMNDMSEKNIQADTYSFSSHGNMGNAENPAHFMIGNDIVNAYSDFSVLGDVFEGKNIFISACNIATLNGSIDGNGFNLIENMSSSTHSTVIGSAHKVPSGYMFDGSNELDGLDKTNSNYNEYYFSSNGSPVELIHDVTIDKKTGIKWE